MGSGDKLDITANTPKDVAALRQSLIATLTSKVAGGATPYGGSVAYGFDPLQTQAANIMSQYNTGTPYSPSKGIGVAAHPGGTGGINFGGTVGAGSGTGGGGTGGWNGGGGGNSGGYIPPGPGPENPGDPGSPPHPGNPVPRGPRPIPTADPYAAQNQQLANLIAWYTGQQK